jgi:virginiamycin B lyase
MRLHRVLLWLALVILVTGNPILPVAADIIVGEASSGAAGTALWELNRDAAGMLYTSDYDLGVILAVNPATGAYTRFEFDHTPSDVKPDASGALWWSDFLSAFGTTDPGSGLTTYWDLDAALSPSGLAPDASGNIWLAQSSAAALLRFTPSSRSLCSFEVFGASGGGDYPIFYNGMIWVGDTAANRIVRFDPATNQLRSWNLPTGSAAPKGLAFDTDGRLWWAGQQLGQLGRLAPDTGEAALYALSAGARPLMVAAGAGVIWYADESGKIGTLDPARAVASVALLASGTAAVTPTCSVLPAGSTLTAAKSSGALSFTDKTWVPAPGSPVGVTTYRGPASDQVHPHPLGLAFSDGRAWFTDYARGTLVRMPPLLPGEPVNRSLYLPLVVRQ